MLVDFCENFQLFYFCETHCGCHNTQAASLSEKMVLVRRLEINGNNFLGKIKVQRLHRDIF